MLDKNFYQIVIVAVFVVIALIAIAIYVAENWV